MADRFTQPFLAAPVPARASDQAQLNWNARQWVELETYVQGLERRLQSLIDFLGENMTLAGHGWMSRLVALPVTMDQTWRLVTFSASTGFPKHVSFDPALGRCTFLTGGYWAFNFQIFHTFTETDGSRRMRIRLVNAANPGVAVLEGIIPVGRNQDGARYNSAILIDANTVGAAPATFYLEMRADTGDVFAAVVNEASNMTIYNVGQFPAGVVPVLKRLAE